MTDKNTSRRNFIRNASLSAGGLVLLGPSALNAAGNLATAGSDLKISVAEWSWHKTLFGGKMTNLDFAAKARAFEIEAIEYVSVFFNGKEKEASYLKDLNMRASDNGVTQLLIMVDREGNLGDADDKKRMQAVENHKKWLEAAKTLGCHSIRVNAAGEGSYEEVHNNAINGLGSLAELAKPMGLNVIVENHGGFSSNGDWLSSVIGKVGMDNCGTLPDFGNFCIERTSDGCNEEYDRYKGVKQLMPFAKAVSAKTHDFDEKGNEIHTDYKKMMGIVKKAGYSGWVGIEYEGSKLEEDEGIMATKRLLEKYI